MDFVAIDFEASCLPRHGRSFPIEVAICGPEGTRNWLIRPHPLWHEWDWTEEAARLHRISRDMLERQGLAPHLVWAELTEAIAGRRVIADSPVDAHWWSVLGSVSGDSATCPVEHVGLALDRWSASASEIAAAKRFADQHCESRHRAGPDALWLWCVLARLEQMVAARSVLARAA